VRVDLQSRKIVVTGGGGFLGRYVVRRLREMGCKRITVPRSAEFDLTREQNIRRLLGPVRPDVVIHLAAVAGGIEANGQYPGTILYKNLMMGAQLIDACRQIGVEKFVQAGPVWARRQLEPAFADQLCTNGSEEVDDPYVLAKKILIEQLDAYQRQFGFNGINILLADLYGPGDNFDSKTSRVIPAFVRGCLEAREQGYQTLSLRGTGRSTRHFLYVTDAAEAICLATERMESSEPIAIGAGDEISIAALAERIAHKCGFQGEIHFDGGRPDAQRRTALDVTQARETIGFQASTSLDEGLDRTIAWYKADRAQTSRRAA
jgi:GDP-L-fucose synthase